MKYIEYFLRNRSFTSLVLALVLLGGVFSYVKMGKLEDAPFTIKQALVLTSYPGASADEVRSQVTDVLEEAIQALGELYYLKTENRPGSSKITVYVKKEIRADAMQQLWDNLRRKVGDVQSKLPAGASPSVVKDDFGDVLGVFYGLTGEGKSYRELEEQAKLIKNDLLQVKDVAKVELYGLQTPTIEIELRPSVMASAGLTVADVAAAFEKQNRVVDGGAIETDEFRIRVESTGTFYSLDEIGAMTIVSSTGEHFRISDIAIVSEGYMRPSRNMMRINNAPAVGIAVSTVPTGNVVDMALLVKNRIAWFTENMESGFSLSSVYDQGHESAVANDGFLLNLVVSVLTVVAILLFFIGFKNGLLVGSGLLFSIFATLIWMYVGGIALQRMSLAAIIIAMGMLVDNAIVVSDAALVNMQKGMRKRPAILQAVSSTAIPLLAATVIGGLTFLPIYLSPHITGELMSSVFIVIAVSLMFSWVFAVTQTPFVIELFARRPRPEELKSGDLFSGRVYDGFRRSLRWVIRYRYAAIGTVVLLLVLSVWSFKFIPRVFVPSLDKQYFTIDTWMPEGTRIEKTDEVARNLSAAILANGEVESVSTYIGQSPPRYYLANISFGPQSNFSQLLVKCHTSKEARALQKRLAGTIRSDFPELFMKVNRFDLSPSQEAMIEARFRGPDPGVLDSLAGIAVEIMRSNPKTKDARQEWRNRVLVFRPEYDPVKAARVGLSKDAMMQAVKASNDGLAVGVYRDNEKKVPVLLRAPFEGEQDMTALENLYVWNGNRSAPLAQLTKGVSVDWEWSKMCTYNRRLSMAAQCDPQRGHTMAEVHGEIREEIEAITLPEGYDFFWDAQFKDQSEAMAALAMYFPMAFLFLVVILVALFRNFREPLLIISILPLSLIGVAIGMLLTGFDFGFFPVAGWLGLLGMIIKNVIVLIDEINVQKREGATAYTAIVEATVCRARPVIMAAATTVLGMVPLLFDIAFGGMAATIIFGLTFATILTLFITPALYVIFYKVKQQ